MIRYPPPPIFEAPFRVSRAGVSIDSDPAISTAVAEAFDRYQGAVFSQVIEPDLLELLLGLARSARFDAVATADFGDRGIARDERTALPMCMALARSNLLDWLQQVTGCEPISTVEGVLARMQPGDILEWHRDLLFGVRRLAVVINLSEAPFEGGRFEMRRRGSMEPLFAYDHVVPGSVMIFRLGADLQHRVTPVTAGGPRLAFAGWLRAPIQPDEDRRLPNVSARPPGA